jgi:hypothetical protein
VQARLIERYVVWAGHTAGGTLPPEDVLAGVLRAERLRTAADLPPLEPDETLVLVPPQWIGDWESGYRLAPGYQHLWRVPLAALRPPPDPPLHQPYRPAELPLTARGPSLRRPPRT